MPQNHQIISTSLVEMLILHVSTYDLRIIMMRGHGKKNDVVPGGGPTDLYFGLRAAPMFALYPAWYFLGYAVRTFVLCLQRQIQEYGEGVVGEVQHE